MVLNLLAPQPIPQNSDTNSISTAMRTPPETVVAADNFLDDQDPFDGTRLSAFSVPWPGSTFIIRAASSGHVLTFYDAQVMLAPPGGRGSIHWACVENEGRWLGFRNVVTGSFLGHDKKGRLCCIARTQNGWENFCARMRPEGGYVLLMTHYERLWSVGFKVEQGVEKLAKIENEGPDEIVWEFVKV